MKDHQISENIQTNPLVSGYYKVLFCVTYILLNKLKLDYFFVNFGCSHQSEKLCGIKTYSGIWQIKTKNNRNWIWRILPDARSISMSLTKNHRGLVHTMEKPYQCKVCTYSSARESALKRHTRIHTGEKIFTCTKCEMAFTYKLALNKHFVTHTDAWTISVICLPGTMIQNS